ncbi:hypothetical protein [Vannielia sp.]|uniref:hypothetical protein n=1 Tax=Vannielia sp. TaxID=2813045 RepID=UPI00260E1543|nr:hypothetical protein [Vannielia sp.]MDF1871419.1 hypothetical protein [Vannielia sp.]
MIKVEHELHGRRFGRNVGLGLSLAGLVVIVLLLTVVKVTRGSNMEAFDHSVRPSMTVDEETGN